MKRFSARGNLMKVVLLLFIGGIIPLLYINNSGGMIFRGEGNQSRQEYSGLKASTKLPWMKTVHSTTLVQPSFSYSQGPDGNFSMNRLIEEESTLVSLRENIFKERRNHINHSCTQLKLAVSETSQSLPQRVSIAEKHGIIYCGLPKTGSTFWRRTLTIIENQQKFSSLYEYRNAQVTMENKLKQLGEVRVSMNKTAFESFLKDAMSFVFVREPYGRVFSAYNNKILNPNFVYWKAVGRKVVAKVRKQPSADSIKYGHDVTFSELIEFLVLSFEQDEYIDQHFAQMNKRCNPCRMQFDYIGKMETFSDDSRFLIAKIREKYKDVFIKFEDFDDGTALDTAQGHIKFLFHALYLTKDIKYPRYNFFLRTWRDLQIRGFLSKHIDMPLTRDKVSNMTQESFFSMVKEALAKPMNKTEVKQQRNDAMIQAYRKVPLHLMERLKNYLRLDCEVFGYDVRPAVLFDRNDSNADDEFNYFDDI